MPSTQPGLMAVILAGGRGSRLGAADKPLVRLGDRPLLEWGLEKIRRKTAQVLLSVNHNPENYAYLDLPLVPDALSPGSGPLAGIYSAMDWIARNHPQNPPGGLLCLPADVPVFPDNLVEVLRRAFRGPDGNSPCDVAWCECGGQVQPLFSLWSLSCRDTLRRAIGEGLHGPRLLMPRLDNRLVNIPRQNPLDFHNINEPADLERASRLIGSY